MAHEAFGKSKQFAAVIVRPHAISISARPSARSITIPAWVRFLWLDRGAPRRWDGIVRPLDQYSQAGEGDGHVGTGQLHSQGIIRARKNPDRLLDSRSPIQEAVVTLEGRLPAKASPSIRGEPKPAGLVDPSIEMAPGFVRPDHLMAANRPRLPSTSATPHCRSSSRLMSSASS